MVRASQFSDFISQTVAALAPINDGTKFWRFGPAGNKKLYTTREGLVPLKQTKDNELWFARKSDKHAQIRIFNIHPLTITDITTSARSEIPPKKTKVLICGKIPQCHQRTTEFLNE